MSISKRRPEGTAAPQEELTEVILGDEVFEDNMSGPNFEERVADPATMDCISDMRNKPLECVDDVSLISFHPLVRQLQQIVLYETKSRYYIIGSNVSATQFYILKVDRTEPRELLITEEASCHSRREIVDILNMVDSGNTSRMGQKVGTGLTKRLSAFGIAGFVRFLEGYYIIFITKRRKAAMIGPHCIYKIEDVELKYIPNDEVRRSHPDESRYLKLFMGFDFSSNFYFSYSYDLTNTLQHNMMPPTEVMSHDGTLLDIAEAFPDGKYPAELCYVSQPNERYVWNDFLTKPIRDSNIRQDWILPIIHGFVDQSNISIHGRPVLLTLIARRSRKYAGTRFLKRGANFEGDVANEVETEQIVGDSSISELQRANLSSFVQFRGSIPAHWCQDLSKMVPKPQIFFELSDPNYQTAGKHFNYLMQKYGTPIVILNLVKKKEKKRRHEVLLGEDFSQQISYLNTFLPKKDALQYVALDMARSKRKHEGVMPTLERIANYAVKNTGIFHSKVQAKEEPTCWNVHPLSKSYTEKVKALPKDTKALLQTGVVRTNCVDCLDRTNTAQFVVAKAALGLQLFALGFLPTPDLQHNSDCARILESMFEDHGDTLALQYGGSQLIHRIKSYRKEAKWTSKANDITQTVRRYYSNALSDAEKQATMNLFLGVFKPMPGHPAIWDREQYTSEHYLHFPELQRCYDDVANLTRVQVQWWNRRLRLIMPYSMVEREKKALQLIAYNKTNVALSLNYEDFYRPNELTVMSEMFQYKDVGHSVRDYMPNCCTDYSPFVVRFREVRRREEAANTSKQSAGSALLQFFTSTFGSTDKSSGGAGSTARADVEASAPSASKNPNVDANVSTSSISSNDSDEDDEDDSDSTCSEDFAYMNEPPVQPVVVEEPKIVKMNDIFGKNDMTQDMLAKPEDSLALQVQIRNAEMSLPSSLEVSLRQSIMIPPINFKTDTNPFLLLNGGLQPMSDETTAEIERYVSFQYNPNQGTLSDIGAFCDLDDFWQ